jgi:hypothetical protein
MDEIRREARDLQIWRLEPRVHLTAKEKIAVLRLLKECNEAKFTLFEKDLTALNVKGMEEKLVDIKSANKSMISALSIFSLPI